MLTFPLRWRSTVGLALIEIQGTAAQLRSLTGIDELHIAPASSARLGPDRWRVSGYASPAAQDEVQTRGATVEVLETEEQVQAHLDEAYEGIDDTPVA